MSRPIYFSRTDMLPSLSKLSYATRLKWTKLRLRMEDRGLILLAVPEHQIDRFAWKIYIDKKHYRSPFTTAELAAYLKRSSRKKLIHPANADLTLLFQPDKNIVLKNWDDLAEQFYAFIICVSTKEIDRNRSQYLQEYLIYHHRVLTNFPFIDVFKSVRHRINEKQALYDQLVETIWDLFLAWLHTFRSMKRHLPKRLSIKSDVFNFPDPLTFQKQLPSAQYLLILLQHMCIEILGYGNPKLLHRYMQNAHEIVKTNIEQYSQSIVKTFDNERAKDHSFLHVGEQQSVQQLKGVFLDMVQEDLHILMFQEILVDSSKLNIKEHFSDTAVAPLLIKKSNFEIWMESMTASRLKDHLMFPSTKAQSSIWPDLPELVDPSCSLIGRSDKTIDLFKEAAIGMKNDQLLIANKFIKRNWQNQFLGLSDFLTYPFFEFTIRNQRLVPQWNLIDQTIGEQLLDDRAVLDERLRVRHHELQNHLKENKRKSAQKKIPIDLGKDVVSQNIIHQHNSAIDIRLAVRRQKKSEFGIINDSRTDEDYSEIWLNEMIQIEEEIAPYIIFVKNAFQSALPIRKHTEINHDRHSSDGVDFDPESIQDTQKWMHGEIMTTLKTTTKRRSAAQINAFVLDASGSMDHVRMRNLFKMLVLMVMGLEDRKSFDSFHFFNYNFIEGAKFSGTYTNRTLLFRILKRIATIEEGKVLYAGNGGTNMSDGIMECHDRIQAFHKYLQKQHPDMVFLKSLFVISDGQPSVGITDPNVLHGEINKRRGRNEVAIKGIYLKPPDEKRDQSFMLDIFGANNFVESDNFATAINELVHIMAGTYKKQRQNLKYQKTNLI